MIKLVGIAITIVLTSFYLFPFCFTFLPSANTKMIMAGFSLIILIYRLGKHSGAVIDNDIMKLSIVAGVVSMIGWLSAVFNNTMDYTYTTYIVSMWVWLGGAYTLTVFMHSVHGGVSVRLMCNYMITVGTLQCLIALGMDYFPWLKNFVDSFLYGTGFMGKMPDRMYGIGCALDVAGAKFSALLVMISFIVASGLRGHDSFSIREMYAYVISFIILAVIGNMISRSTAVGIIIGAIVFVLYWNTHEQRLVLKFNKWNVIGSLLLIFTCGVMSFVYLYNHSPEIYKHLRFAFEGFFSLVETGDWHVGSNDMLKNMVIWPDNLKTWIIGDGYFDSPQKYDPYYIGYNPTEYYKGTDIGYLRFIFYFGLVGLASFIWYFGFVARCCIRRFPIYRLMFIGILFVNFAMWFKVASDIFVVFAPFLCISAEEDAQYTEYLESKSRLGLKV